MIPPDSPPPVTWGILNPREIIQSATFITTWSNLRTDSSPSPQGDLYLDQAHNWVGNKVDISINNLQRLYVKNGTFSAGINGTNINGVGAAHPLGWSDESNREGNEDMTQRTTFLNTSGYVTVENQGEDADIDGVVGIALNGIPFATYVGKELNKDLIVYRPPVEKSKTGTFSSNFGPIEGKRVVLIDDVVDTGGTLKGAIQALKESDAEPILSVVIISKVNVDSFSGVPLRALIIASTLS